MATKYVSSLTGEEMDAALIDMAYHNSEAYAVGTRNGVEVGSSDVTYHNNSKYYAEQVYGYTDRAEDAAARAEAAVPAGTAGAVFFDRAQSLTTAQQSQARANIMAGGTNPNLLDNWYFVGGGSQLGDGVFPINQRGLLNYGAGHTIDRWKLSSGGTLVFTNDGISINGLFFQKKVIDFTVGETYTLSRQTTDGNVVSVTGVVPSTEGWMIGNQTFGVYFRPSTKVCDIQIWGTYLLKAVKLEKGTVSTLANDVPPDFGEELRKCQRYLWIVDVPANTQLGSGIALTADQADVSIILPVPMRTPATPAFTTNVLLIGNGQICNAASVTGIDIYDNICRLLLSSTGLTPYYTYSFWTGSQTRMIISAEP